MKLVTTLFAIGLLMPGALQMAAAQSTATNPNPQPAASTVSTGDRDTYTLAMQNDMRIWQQKLHDYTEIARARGQQADKTAENALNTAWNNTQTEARKVSTASAEGWASAKSSYEHASRELTIAWDKARQ